MTVEKFKRAEEIIADMNRLEKIEKIINNNTCEAIVEVIYGKVVDELDRLKAEFESL